MSAAALVLYVQLENSVNAFQAAAKGELPKENALVIRLETLNPRVNAEIRKEGDELVIQVMGGMLQHKRMTPDVLTLLLCHELGHFLGGPPLKSRAGWSSTEGQADYYSGMACAHRLGLDEMAFADAALALTQIYAEVTFSPPPRLDRCDESVVSRTNFGYPGVQCRLDTLMAGWWGRERPRCWFSE
jgi:hypothetical protein